MLTFIQAITEQLGISLNIKPVCKKFKPLQLNGKTRGKLESFKFE